jgi:hypothetical protein
MYAGAPWQEQPARHLERHSQVQLASLPAATLSEANGMTSCACPVRFVAAHAEQPSRHADGNRFRDE